MHRRTQKLQIMTVSIFQVDFTCRATAASGLYEEETTVSVNIREETVNDPCTATNLKPSDNWGCLVEDAALNSQRPTKLELKLEVVKGHAQFTKPKLKLEVI
jgi:hypothetical protein